MALGAAVARNALIMLSDVCHPGKIPGLKTLVLDEPVPEHALAVENVPAATTMVARIGDMERIALTQLAIAETRKLQLEMEAAKKSEGGECIVARHILHYYSEFRGITNSRVNDISHDLQWSPNKSIAIARVNLCVLFCCAGSKAVDSKAEQADEEAAQAAAAVELLQDMLEIEPRMPIHPTIVSDQSRRIIVAHDALAEDGDGDAAAQPPTPTPAGYAHYPLPLLVEVVSPAQIWEICHAVAIAKLLAQLWTVIKPCALA